MKLPRLRIFLSAIAAVVLVIGVFSALVLPRLIDSQSIKEKISAELVKQTTGRVTVGKIALLWFPRPSVVIENAELSFDDKTEGSIRTLQIYPSILHLLTGRVLVRRALLQEPKLRILLPERAATPFDLEELERQIRSVLVRLAREWPARRIDVSDGSAEIRIGDKPPVILENVSAQSTGSSAELVFELSARSNLSERFKVEGKISPEGLASQLAIGVQRLKIKESLTVVPLQSSEYLQHGEASFDVKIVSAGLRKVKASIEGSVGPVVLARGGGTATVEAKRLKGGISYESGAFQVDVLQLELGAPRLQASGELKIEPGLFSARIGVRDVDIGQVNDLVMRIADDAEGVKGILRHIPAGTIPEMSIQSVGHSFADMALSKNLVVSGLLRDCQISIPGIDFELRNVTGSVRISDGILEADGVGANHGTTKGWNGKLRLGLEGQTAPLHLDILLHSSAPELHSVMLKLVRDERFRGELLKVRNIAGELSGRLILGGRLNAITPVATISKAEISATYALIPFPIAIRGGRFSYDQRLIRFESVDGSVGRTTFGGLSGTLHQDGSRHIKVDSGRGSLDLQQTDAWLRSFENLRPYFEKLATVRGQIELDNLTLGGAYDDPAAWTFASGGRFDQIEIAHADFPGPITLSRGKFAAIQGRIILSNAAAAVSDASLIGGGTFEYKKGGPFQIETSGTGTIGAQMSQWLSRYVELPEELKLRSPLKIAAGHLAWRAGGDISFRGQVTVASGPLITLDAVKHPQAVTLKNLTIDDGDWHARIMLQLTKDHLDFSFGGELTQQTIDRVFTSFPAQASLLRGDIHVSASLANTITVSARGQLSGSNLRIPFGTEKALVEKFAIEAVGSSVLLRSADLRWGKSRLTVSGKVTGAREILRLDLDVTGDRLDWEELQRSFDGEGKRWQHKKLGIMSIPDVEATIRLKTDRFTFERFNLSPLETTAAISPSGISADIHYGVVCGITVTGRVDAVGKEIGLDLQLAASEAQLEPATVCLTNQQNDVKGIYSLNARVAGHGDRDHLLRSLKGNFELSARNGEFIRSPGIDATFDYLNATGDFKVAFPDLDRQTFPYRFFNVKGRIEGEMLVGDEINVGSSVFNLSGQGKVDLERKQIDGRGLIAVLKPVDEVLSRVPVISSVLGPSLVGIPVRVTGSLDRPDVTYLSSADVGVELLNIPLRILGMPLGAMRLFTPSGDLRDRNITK